MLVFSAERRLTHAGLLLAHWGSLCTPSTIIAHPINTPAQIFQYF